MFIAIFIICVVFTRKLKVYKSIALSLACFVFVIAMFQIPYRIHVPKDIRDAHSIPPTHWVMMSLQNSGRGTWEEFAATMSHPTYAAKTEFNIEVIKTRLREMGPRGFGELMMQKMGILYSRPDMQPDGIIPFDNSETAMRLGRMIFNNIFYLVYNGIFFYGAVILAFVSIFLRARNFTAYLAMFGIHLFFVFWEVNARWLTNHLWVIVFLACLSLKALTDEYRQANPGKPNFIKQLFKTDIL